MMRSLSVLLLIPSLLTACGDGATTSTDPSGDTVLPSTTTVPTTPATTGITAVEVPPCDLLSATEVSAATGLDVVEVIEESSSLCIFDLGIEAGVDLFLSMEGGEVSPGSPAAVFEEYTSLIDDAEAEAVTGLGEGAVYAAGFRGLAIDAGGGRFMLLGVNGGYQHLQDPRDVLISLAATALERL